MQMYVFLILMPRPADLIFAMLFCFPSISSLLFFSFFDNKASPSDRPSKKRALPIPLLSPVASRGATFTPSSTSSSSSTSSTPGKVVARLVTPSRSDTFLAFFGDASSAPLWASPSSIPPSVLSEFVSSPLTIRLPSSSFSTVDLDGFSEFQNNVPPPSPPTHFLPFFLALLLFSPSRFFSSMTPLTL